MNDVILSSPSAKVRYKDQVIVDIFEKAAQNIVPKKIKLDIVFEDKSILVINKPKGMVVHPGAGNYKNTLAISMNITNEKILFQQRARETLYPLGT